MEIYNIKIVFNSEIYKYFNISSLCIVKILLIKIGGLLIFSDFMILFLNNILYILLKLEDDLTRILIPFF